MAILALLSAGRVCAAASPVPSQQFPLRVPDALGVNIHFTDPQPGEMEMLLASGVRWVRADFSWSASERAVGVYDFSAYERLMELCSRNKLRVMVVLAYSNPLYDGDLSPHSDGGVAAFSKWAAAAANHFKGRGALWEIYNEPNNVFWRPTPDVKAYIKLAAATAKAIRAAAPDEMIVGPALSGTDSAWLEPCYRGGLLEYFSAVTVHPYGNEPPEDRERHYRGVRALIDRYQPKGRAIPILSGEWGYSSAAGAFTPEMQGKLLARQWLFNLSMNVPLSIWYDWRDDGPDPNNAEQRFGMVANAYHKGREPVLDPKPAYLAAQTLTKALDGFTFAARMPLAKGDEFLLRFERGKEVRYAAWTTSAHPRRVTLTLPAGDYALVLFDGSGSAAAHWTNGSTVELSDGPMYLTPK
jgi:hypothetical protein